jgi:hypothetical protein
MFEGYYTPDDSGNMATPGQGSWGAGNYDWGKLLGTGSNFTGTQSNVNQASGASGSSLWNNPLLNMGANVGLGLLLGGNNPLLTGMPPGMYSQTGSLTPAAQQIYDQLYGQLGQTPESFNINVGGTQVPVMSPFYKQLLNQLGGFTKDTQSMAMNQGPGLLGNVGAAAASSGGSGGILSGLGGLVNGVKDIAGIAGIAAMFL